MKKESDTTKIPGPQAQQWVKRDQQVISPSYTRQYPLVVESAKGLIVTDVDGNRYLDFTSGIAVTATGHCHPKVVKAIRAQARRFIHMSGTDFYYPQEVLLAERLAALTGGDRKSFLTNSGTESIEAAMKLSRYTTRRPYFISFLGSFHGRTFGALSLTGSKAVHRNRFTPLVPSVLHAPFPNPYRPPAGISPDQCCGYVLDLIRNQIFRHLCAPEEVAAIFVEPIQGEGGYIVPPFDFLKGLLALAHEFGILLVVDEVQSGIGRTGTMFSYEHSDVTPDIIAIAKGIASGLPLGAMVAKSGLMSWEPGAHANTFGGNPIACEAALATLDLVQNGLMQNSAKIGAFLLSRLKKMQESHHLIGDVRGLGLMIGIELVRDKITKEPAVAERNQVIQRCFERGLLILGCGVSTVRFAPPLTIKRTEAETALVIFEETLAEVEKA
ncbi:MAG: acetyl ornithine aminotransferase family protein [Nitrospirae bacterium]|nr:acetyl ornithine aminotransferase family protein [Candidatus Troglogloeales bacterium]